MTTSVLQKEVASPIEQEAYQLLGQLNEHNIIITVNFMKKLIAEENHIENEQDELARKRAAFARLMELREEIAASNLPSVDEIRREAIEQKYGYMMNKKKE